MRLPDGARSRAILIGSSQFADPELPGLPAVRNNLASLAEILTRPAGSGLPPDRCAVLADPPDLATVGERLEAVAADSHDLLFVYYSGHGLVDAKGQLCLALPSTRADRLRWTAIPFGHIREVLADAPATNRVLVLDCCFSGRAIEAMADPISAVSGQIDIAGTYTLTSSPANTMSNAQQGAKHTAFTGELLRILSTGIPGAPALLTFDSIYPELVRALLGRGLPRPEQRNTRTTAMLALVPNHADNTASDTDGRTENSHVALRQADHHDPLTGLLNLTGFHAAASPVRHEQHPVVIRIDFDLPNAVSEAVGRSWGDRVVITAASRLLAALGVDALVARLAAGSFAVLLTGHDERQAHRQAEFLRETLAMPYPVNGMAVEADVAVGYALTVDDQQALDALLGQAGLAAQAAGTDDRSVLKYDEPLGRIQARRFRLIEEFGKALETGQVCLRYQPRIAMSSRQVIEVETSVRWQHPELGQLTGDQFIPTIEGAGLVHLLTSAVLEQALTMVSNWHGKGVRLGTTVNLSPHDLEDETFPDRIAKMLDRHDVPADLLTCDLTETCFMANPDQVLPTLRRLHALGVMLAIDDFGTGYTSLAYLRQLPIDEIKIDRSLLLGMSSDVTDLAVVRSLIELTSALGLSVSADGVEDRQAWDQLADMGCDIAQGHLISPPLPEDKWEEWVLARTTTERGARENEAVLVLRDDPAGNSLG